jgi:hypothetical protein
MVIRQLAKNARSEYGKKATRSVSFQPNPDGNRTNMVREPDESGGGQTIGFHEKLIFRKHIDC